MEEKFNNFMKDNNRGWWTNFALNTFDKMIPDSTWLKDFKDLPNFHMYLAAGLFNGAWWGVFLYFIISAYISGVTDTYISLDSESGDCSEVPFTITGSYLADSSGHWESVKKFNDATALYQADLLSYQSKVADYETLIGTTISNEINSVGEIGKYRDLAWNLIAHATYTYIYRDKGRLEFYPAGEFVTMLDKTYSQYGVYSSDADIAAGACMAGADAVFDYNKAGSKIHMSYDYPSASDSCQKYADTLGYNPGYGTDFNLDIDLIALSTAISVNYGIISPKKIIEITDDPEKGYTYDTDDGDDYSYYYYYYYYDDAATDDAAVTDDATPTDDTVVRKNQVAKSKSKSKSVTNSAVKNSVMQENINNFKKKSRKLTTTSSDWRRFYDSKYTGMEPIHCLIYNNNVANGTCFMHFYDTNLTDIYAYPVVKHYFGTNCSNTSQWDDDWYNSDPTTNGDWLYTYDHTVDIMIGLIVFRDETEAKQFGLDSYNYRANLKDGDLVIPDRVYSSMIAYINGVGGYSAEDVCGINPNTNQPRDCFMWTINQYGPDFFINDHNYQIFAGACRNSLFNNITLTAISKTSPEPLTQTYYECVLLPYDSFFNALGLSLGNADVYAKFAFFGFMLLFVLYLNKTRGFDPQLGVFESPVQEENNGGTDTVNPMGSGIELKGN